MIPEIISNIAFSILEKEAAARWKAADVAVKDIMRARLPGSLAGYSQRIKSIVQKNPRLRSAVPKAVERERARGGAAFDEAADFIMRSRKRGPSLGRAVTELKETKPAAPAWDPKEKLRQLRELQRPAPKEEMDQALTAALARLK